MKKTLFFTFFTLGFLCTTNTFAQMGIGTITPDKSAVLELKSDQRGLLIPRFEITNLSEAAPVINPANSLLVYNTGGASSTLPGFYYWRADAEGPGDGAWVPLGNSTTSLTTLLLAQNGLQMRNDSTVVLGGILDTATTIDANNFAFSLKNLGQANPAAVDSILVKVNDSIVRAISPDSLFNVSFAAVNGLHKIGRDSIALGGVLDTATTLTANATNTLAIKGLQAGPGKLILVDTTAGTEGVLRAVNRSISGIIPATGLNINGTGNNLSGYSYYIQQVYLKIGIETLAAATSDISLSLPNASAAAGQIIKVKIVGNGTTGDTDHYLNINDSSGTLVYGAVPYQSWVFRSTGSEWRIIDQY